MFFSLLLCSVGFHGVGIMGFVSTLTNKSPVPERLKELQFKIASIDLSKEELKSFASPSPV